MEKNKSQSTELCRLISSRSLFQLLLKLISTLEILKIKTFMWVIVRYCCSLTAVSFVSIVIQLIHLLSFSVVYSAQTNQTDEVTTNAIITNNKQTDVMCSSNDNNNVQKSQVDTDS